MQVNDILNLVRKIPLFAGLQPSQVRELLSEGEVRKFRPSQLMCREGEESQFLFIVLRGKVAVQKDDTTVAHISAVEIVGEMGVITDSPRCATLFAEDDVTVMTIPKNRFNYAVGLDAEVAATIYRNVLHSNFGKLQAMNEHFLEHLSGGGFGLATTV